MWNACALADFAGKAQLSKVAAQLLANMSANEGRALHAVWAACFPGAFADLAALPSEARVALDALDQQDYHQCSWRSGLMTHARRRRARASVQSPAALLQRIVRLCCSSVQPERVAHSAAVYAVGSLCAQCRGDSSIRPWPSDLDTPCKNMCGAQTLVS